MNRKRLARLEAAGFRVTTIDELFDLTPEDRAVIETKLALSRKLRDQRKRRGWTQAELAHRLGTSQSRVSQMEVGADKSVTIDLLVKALFALGLTREDLGDAVRASNGELLRSTAIDPHPVEVTPA